MTAMTIAFALNVVLWILGSNLNRELRRKTPSLYGMLMVAVCIWGVFSLGAKFMAKLKMEVMEDQLAYQVEERLDM